MDTKIYTTGELAKLCQVSIRTVQYYDEKGIVQPSAISDGGRRIYSSEDLQRFQLVCLYKNAGLSLKEIKKILKSDNEYKVILEILMYQQTKLDEQIKDMVKLKERITILLDDINFNRTISITDNNELNNLIIKKEHHKKVDQQTNLLLISYVIIMLLTFIIGSMLGDIYMYGAILINVLLLVFLIHFHSSHNAYNCPHCKNKFTINFFQDMISLNNGKKGKYLKCPYCHKKSWLSETFIDD